MNTDPWPSCAAHKQTLRDSLPADCPFRGEAAYRELTKLLDEGFRLIDSKDHSRIGEGLWLVERGKHTCYSCIERLARHPLVKRIREDLWASEAAGYWESEPAPSLVTSNSEPASSTGAKIGPADVRRTNTFTKPSAATSRPRAMPFREAT